MPCLDRLSLISFFNDTTFFCHFIPGIINYFLAGEDQPQTNQPNSQADCQILLVKSKGEVHMHEHEQQLTSTCIRCSMYTPPSDSSMHSHMRRFASRPTPIDLSSKLSLKFLVKSQFLWLGFPLCAFVAGHDTFVNHSQHKCSILQLSLYTSALLLPMPTPIPAAPE